MKFIHHGLNSGVVGAQVPLLLVLLVVPPWCFVVASADTSLAVRM
ncbi:hypothetical protein [Schaalia sp. ZJ1691]|nr:hypothetical protein [Schaalia sp. ZJ1691]